MTCQAIQQSNEDLQDRLKKTAKLFDISKFNICDSLTRDQKIKVEKLLSEFRYIQSYSSPDIALVKGYKQILHTDKYINPLHTKQEKYQ